MANFSEIVKRYTIRHDKKIKAVTEPLNNYLNIFNFTYFKIEEDGRFITLSNNPIQLDFYYSEKYYLQNPYLIDPNLLRSGAVMTATTRDEKYLDTVQSSLQRFQMNNTFLMIEKKEWQIEGFLFATKLNKNLKATIYFDYFELLKKFNRYFVREMQPLLEKMRSELFNLKQEKGALFSQRKEGLPLAAKDKIPSNFLKSISPLSPQEMRCLTLFREGFSAQATANKLGLSRRTVEHYFENIKNKLNCQSKWDLLQLG